ncbi:MAG: hypothetical protein COB50_03820 [Thiotrichales bacterium]|nr:MAG: hypothetical protein COB50_03820 [Thiotrichales bacterium]
MSKAYIKLQRDKRLLICGAITFNSVLAILKQSTAYFEELPAIVIDFSDLHKIDSSVIALLLHWQRQAQEYNKIVRYIHVPKAVQELGELSNLEKILDIWNN